MSVQAILVAFVPDTFDPPLPSSVQRVITPAVGEGESDVGVEKAISYQ